MSPARKTRSMAPGRFNNGRVSPKSPVHKTYEETFNSEVKSLNLDQDDPLVASVKRKEKERHVTMAKVRELDPIKVNSSAGLLFKKFPNEVSLFYFYLPPTYPKSLAVFLPSSPWLGQRETLPSDPLCDVGLSPSLDAFSAFTTSLFIAMPTYVRIDSSKHRRVSRYQ